MNATERKARTVTWTVAGLGFSACYLLLRTNDPTHLPALWASIVLLVSCALLGGFCALLANRRDVKRETARRAVEALRPYGGGHVSNIRPISPPERWPAA